MKKRKKILGVFLAVAAAAVLLLVGVYSGRNVGQGETGDAILAGKPTLNLWYTDESLEDFLASAALDFSEERNVRVIPTLVSGLEYLESIQEASLSTNAYPDLYILGNESLEKAWLTGLASEIRDAENSVSAEHFPETAIRAVSYQGKTIGYPFFFETSALVYNKTYLEEMAAALLEAEADALAGQEAMAALDENGEPVAGEDAATGEPESAAITEEAIAQRAEELIPTTIDGILSFADSYNAPEQVEAVFRWDVSDIFYNYFFVGNYADVGGPYGDDENSIDIYNEETIRCLTAYQDLNQFFSIDPDEVTYESVVQDFLDGKLVFTVATTDILNRLEEAVADGSFPYEYGVTRTPDIDGELGTRSLSVTNVAVVNGYSEQKETANAFARFLTQEASAELYESAHKLPAFTEAVPETEQAAAFAGEYAQSVPIPKMMTTSNYWVQMEIAFTQIWGGEEVSETLRGLSEQILSQVKGEAVTEEYIEPPVQETQTETGMEE